MGFLKDWAKSAKDCTHAAALHLTEKNRLAALANRLRMVIRCEEKAAEKEYLALGRYYYNALRDRENPVAEPHCARIDEIQARRDSALEDLERVIQINKAASIGVIGGADGPTAIFVTRRKKPGTLFHFNKGPIEVTVTRDEDIPYDPEDENSEEIDLSDVKQFEQDPLSEEGLAKAGQEAQPAADHKIQPAADHKIQPAADHKIQPAAELDENDDLPFEG
ncbi:hypothetical protein D7X94_15590 [Acutalibacter sp. 1XD8-33]|uniref:hypothetical protein n=1 Tax=Acutalibacter sp. 1XD8-33 TaxID=2320081 RepID=UPI000EA17591|nr:hypothetical protein [Acutalibacter sp. 1XD8-33]RKJ38625.1 hypothetical protein D7X94_15590 [Acutalibacter sp. 1XD8-33]